MIVLVLLTWTVTRSGKAAQPSGAGGGAIKLWPQYVKMDSWAAKIPVPRSTEIVDIGFTGRYATYEHADTWYPSWAADGNLYSPWTDGRVGNVSCSSGGKDARTGQAKVEGDDPLHLRITCLGTFPGDPSPYEGRYPCGSLVFDGVWYYGTYCLLDHPAWSMNWPILGPFVGFRISRDLGKTWTPPAPTPANALFGEKTSVWGAEPVKMGSPHFVDLGRNLEHSPDGRAYLVGHGATAPDPNPRVANLSWITGDEIYLARVRPSPETINDLKSYEFFAGSGPDGEPVWSADFSKIKPIFAWNNHCGCVTMTFDAPLRKYL
ncbi:MAG TPA: hypothetical protein VEG35_01380, partial [Burkholderiales bacterium]|nr:hypothetical protein [Burkholderiales bacterium]